MRRTSFANYLGYLPELELHEYEDYEKDVFCNAPTESSLLDGCKPSSSNVLHPRALVPWMCSTSLLTILWKKFFGKK